MGTVGVDYSFSHPAPSALKAAGVGLVVRYTTGDKAITVDEATALRSLDIAIALVHETDAGRVNTGGTAGGNFDATQSKTFADALGYPADGTIFYADDTTPNLDAARAYFQGVKAVQRTRPVGWYGGLQVGRALKQAGLVDVLWVANAASWSGFRTWNDMAPTVRADPLVSMLQSLAHPLNGIAPSSYDLDEVLHSFPAWGLRWQQPPAPPAPPKPIPPVVRIKGVSLDVTTMPLDQHGNGMVDAPGIPPEKVTGLTIVGLHLPSAAPVGYVSIPRLAVATHPQTARIVLEGGVPGGRYVVRVTHV